MNSLVVPQVGAVSKPFVALITGKCLYLGMHWQMAFKILASGKDFTAKCAAKRLGRICLFCGQRLGDADGGFCNRRRCFNVRLVC